MIQRFLHLAFQQNGRLALALQDRGSLLLRYSHSRFQGRWARCQKLLIGQLMQHHVRHLPQRENNWDLELSGLQRAPVAAGRCCY